MEGQRTGTRTKYSKHLLGWSPESAPRLFSAAGFVSNTPTITMLMTRLAYPAVLPGTKSTQLTVASNAIFFFWRSIAAAFCEGHLRAQFRLTQQSLEWLQFS
jgi:hypothetical protein